MNSLLEKEGLAGQVQMVNIDPPYGIRYGSNFQPFVNKRDVKDGKDEDLTQEPEMIRAFRDTWELGIHSYLSYLRDRLWLAKELLHESGSCFVQISDENVHLVKSLLDEVFGVENFFSLIPFKTKIPLRTSGLAGICDYLIWYAKDKGKLKFRKLYAKRGMEDNSEYVFAELPDGTRRKLTSEERRHLDLLPQDVRLFRRLDLSSAGQTMTCVFPVEFEGQTFHPTTGKSWKTNQEGMERLIKQKRLIVLGNKLYYVLFYEDYPVIEMTNLWPDTAGGFGGGPQSQDHVWSAIS
jgi:adenine-specific DNA-methyltransferase